MFVPVPNAATYSATVTTASGNAARDVDVDMDRSANGGAHAVDEGRSTSSIGSTAHPYDDTRPDNYQYYKASWQHINQAYQYQQQHHIGDCSYQRRQMQ